MCARPPIGTRRGQESAHGKLLRYKEDKAQNYFNRQTGVPRILILILFPLFFFCFCLFLCRILVLGFSLGQKRAGLGRKGCAYKKKFFFVGKTEDSMGQRNIFSWKPKKKQKPKNQKKLKTKNKKQQ
jgi:hypothetical protein